MVDFVKAMASKAGAEEITAIFKNGSQAVYTMGIFELLKSDPAVEMVYSNETGEIYYQA